MEILFLSQIVPYPPHGGVLQRGYNLIREIGKSNRVHLLAFRHPETLPTRESVEQSLEELNKFCATVEYVDLWPKKSPLHLAATLGCGLFVKSPFSAIAHRSISFRKRVRDILAGRPIDLIHVDTIALAQYSDLGVGLPRVLTHHNIESKLMARRAPHENRRTSRYYIGLQADRLFAYEREWCGKFDVNIFMSQIDAMEMKRILPDLRTAVIPNGVDIDYFRPSPPTDVPPSLIYTGGMNMFANKDAVLHFLKEIWKSIREQVPDVSFYVVGQDPPEELVEMAKRDPGIRVTGYVDDVRPYISQASVYVVPLRVGGGTRLKVLDAMAMAKALVSTSLGCEGIEVSPGTNILVEDDPGAFARAVIGLIRDRAKREEIGRRARELVVSRYSWVGIGKQLSQLYEATVSSKSSRAAGNE